MNKNYSVIGFLAREHGLNGLEALINSNKYELACVFTHKKKPKSEDPNQSVRPEFKKYEVITGNNSIPIYTVDSKAEAEIIDKVLGMINFDLITSISWRRLILKHHLEKARYGGINLHRGKLPEFAGAEPIKRALLSGEKEIYITAHILTEEIDKGRTLATYEHNVNYNETAPFEENVERIKREITPHFGPLLIKSLDILTNDYET